MRQVVCLQWHDAHAGTDTWIHIEDANDLSPYVVWSVGYLLEIGKGGKPGHVSVAQSWSEDDALDSVLHVPVEMVQRVFVLKGNTGGEGDKRSSTRKERRHQNRGVS